MYADAVFFVTQTEDMPNRLCTEADIKLYFGSFLRQSGSHYLGHDNYCNLTSWVSGCEPGWACNTGSSDRVNFNREKDMPTTTRIHDFQPCCAFCPRGMTCNDTLSTKHLLSPRYAHCCNWNVSSILYQHPNRQPEHTCGGANI